LHTRIQMALKTKPASSLNARKTPGQKRSVATVAAILEAAARILETRGLDSYSTNEVAARAGVSIGSLYQYFPSKDAITRALIGRGAEELLADIKTVEIGDVPQAALEQIIDAAVKHQLRRPALARLLDLEEIRLPMGEDFPARGPRGDADLPELSHRQRHGNTGKPRSDLSRSLRHHQGAGGFGWSARRDGPASASGPCSQGRVRVLDLYGLYIAFATVEVNCRAAILSPLKKSSSAKIAGVAIRETPRIALFESATTCAGFRRLAPFAVVGTCTSRCPRGRGGPLVPTMVHIWSSKKTSFIRLLSSDKKLDPGCI
jgi:AcrR family transcriptional regulator